MNIAGIDGGTTYTKVAWRSANSFHNYMSTADKSVDEIVEEMVADKVDAVRCIGTSVPNRFPFQRIALKYKDPLKAESVLQAKGAVWLAQDQNGGRYSNCLVVSIGTGVSYTRILFGKTFRMPLGNSLGGGFLNGMREWAGISWEELDEKAHKGTVVNIDILVRDVLPDHPMGHLVLANCGKLGKQSSECDFWKGIVRTVATSVAKDIAMYSLLCHKVILVGTTSKLTSLRRELDVYGSTMKKRFYNPPSAEFAGAVGAWLG